MQAFAAHFQEILLLNAAKSNFQINLDIFVSNLRFFCRPGILQKG